MSEDRANEIRYHLSVLQFEFGWFELNLGKDEIENNCLSLLNNNPVNEGCNRVRILLNNYVEPVFL